MNIIQKINFLLSASQKKKLLTLVGLLIVGIFFELMGLGIMIPALSIMLKSNIYKEYPSLKIYLEFFGNPSQKQLVAYGMSLLVAVYCLKAIFLFYTSWKQSFFVSQLSDELSRNLFRGYINQPYSFHLQRNSAELLRNIQMEVNQFSSVSLAVIIFFTELSIIISIVFFLVLIEPIGAISISCFLAFFAILFHRLTRNRLLQWGVQRQVHDGEINIHLMQGFGAIKDIKIFGREKFFLNKFFTHNTAKSNIAARQLTLQQIPRLYLELLAVIGLAGLVIIMIFLGKPLDLFLPILGVFAAAAFRMIPSANRIMGSIQNIRYAHPVVSTLFNELKQVHEPEKTKDFKMKYNIEICNNLEVNSISFTYLNNNRQVLNDVSIKIKKGETIGFIGQSGSGKSTLIDIILGLLKPNNGTILVDGKDINIDIHSWQSQIGYVPQNIYLTDDSLRNNVALGIQEDDIDEASVLRAIKSAQLEDFVNSLPEGLNTFMGERGIRLSGGQRQRIGIARALYHDPPVLVLDEATSSLDNKNELGVMDAITAFHGSKTILIVAHRLSTLEKCDRIYKLDKGVVVAEGTLQSFR